LFDTLKIRHFDRLSTGTIRAKAQFRLRRELSRTIRSSLTPALRLGLVGTRHTGALAPMAQQHEVFIVNPNLSVIGKEFFKTMEIQGTVCNLLDKDYSVLDLFPLVTTCHVQAAHSLLD